MTLGMCFLGIRVTSRLYKRVIEEISTKAKLENVLGLDRPLSVAQYLGARPIWENDECVLFPRHARRRAVDRASEDFIRTAARAGFYRDNRFYFGLIAIFALLLGLAIAAAGLYAIFWGC